MGLDTVELVMAVEEEFELEIPVGVQAVCVCRDSKSLGIQIGAQQRYSFGPVEHLIQV
jgi:hypothetical protein